MPPIGDTTQGPQACPDGSEAARTTWKLHREVVLLAGWGRGILLQLAHPMVAQGVADHSGFAEDSWGRVGRLRRTLAAMLALTFGTPEESAGAAAAINRIHDRVHGQLAEGAGPFASSARYSAHDPALLAWVHATLVDTFLITYERFVAPLTPAERDRYCREAGTARPLVALARLPVVGLLPPAIRKAYGFEWTRGQERMLEGLAAATRHALPLLPPFLRWWPAARRAARRSGAPSGGAAR